MLISSWSRYDGWRYRREYQPLMAHTRPCLEEVAGAIGANPSIPLAVQDVSLKVWLLPPWYAKRLLDGDSAVLAASDFLSEVFGRPRVVCAGEIQRGPHSGRSWNVTKGLIGSAIQDEPPREGYHLTKRRAADAELSRSDSRQRADERALDRLYGRSIGVGLRDREDAPPFGCLTLDPPAQQALGKRETEECGQILIVAVPRLVQEIVTWGKYRLG